MTLSDFVNPPFRYRLLGAFKSLFEGQRYRHRSSRLGDWVAMHLYEDLYDLNRSTKLRERIHQHERVLAGSNRRRGVEARRGDGTFGDLVPNTGWVQDAGFNVARGEIASVEIGAEVKILAKAMIKQIDRVINDLTSQVEHLKRKSSNAICVGIVGVNFSDVYTSFEKRRAYRTDGKSQRHPCQEAPDAVRRLIALAAPRFDEFLLLRFRATNAKPFPFEWLQYDETAKDYGAALVRLSSAYDQRF